MEYFVGLLWVGLKSLEVKMPFSGPRGDWNSGTDGQMQSLLHIESCTTGARTVSPVQKSAFLFTSSWDVLKLIEFSTSCIKLCPFKWSNRSVSMSKARLRLIRRDVHANITLAAKPNKCTCITRRSFCSLCTVDSNPARLWGLFTRQIWTSIKTTSIICPRKTRSLPFRHYRLPSLNS